MKMTSSAKKTLVAQIEYNEFKRELLSKKTKKLHTKHPGRSARDYMDPKQTQDYIRNLEATTRLSEQTRNLHIAKGLNPLQELRRALE